MPSRGAGARAAWLVGSRKTLVDLERIFAGDVLEKVDFEAGELAREEAMSVYQQARRNNSVSVKRFSDIRRLRLATIEEAISKFTADVNIFLQDSERKGVFRASAQSLARHAAELLQYDGSSFFASSFDGKKGILLDYDADASKGKQYELEVWG